MRWKLSVTPYESAFTDNYELRTKNWSYTRTLPVTRSTSFRRAALPRSPRR